MGLPVCQGGRRSHEPDQGHLPGSRGRRKGKRHRPVQRRTTTPTVALWLRWKALEDYRG